MNDSHFNGSADTVAIVELEFGSRNRESTPSDDENISSEDCSHV